MQVNKNFRWYRPENRQYYIMIQNELQDPKALQTWLSPSRKIFNANAANKANFADFFIFFA